MRAVSFPSAMSAILSAPAQAASIDVIFAREIVGMLESDGCDEGLNLCDGEIDCDGVVDGLAIGCFVGHSIVNTLIEGAGDGRKVIEGETDGTVLGDVEGVIDDAGSKVGLLVQASLFSDLSPSSSSSPSQMQNLSYSAHKSLFFL